MTDGLRRVISIGFIAMLAALSLASVQGCSKAKNDSDLKYSERCYNISDARSDIGLIAAELSPPYQITGKPEYTTKKPRYEQSQCNKFINLSGDRTTILIFDQNASDINRSSSYCTKYKKNLDDFRSDPRYAYFMLSKLDKCEKYPGYINNRQLKLVKSETECVSAILNINGYLKTTISSNVCKFTPLFSTEYFDSQIGIRWQKPYAFAETMDGSSLGYIQRTFFLASRGKEEKILICIADDFDHIDTTDTYSVRSFVDSCINDYM